MASSELQGVLHYVRLLAGPGAGLERPDEELLGAFASHRDPAAFESLLKRHGAMVFSVSRRVLGNEQDAEDVFQATFLLLARRSIRIRRPGSVASWLHGVALRLAIKAREKRGGRRSREKRAAEMRDKTTKLQTRREIEDAVDAAVQKLPAKYRTVVILCYIEGRTQEEVARQLGCPLGTIRSRLAEARRILRRYLVREGMVPKEDGRPVDALILAGVTRDSISTALHQQTLKAVVSVTAGKAIGQVVSSEVAALVAMGVKLMASTKLSSVMVIVLGCGLCFGGAAAVAYSNMGAPQSKTRQTDGARGRSGLKSLNNRVALSDLADRAADNQQKSAAQMTVVGHIKDSADKPAAGAEVAVVVRPGRLPRGGARSGDRVVGETKADREGRFSLQVPRPGASPGSAIVIVAGREGAGLAVQQLDPDAERVAAEIQLPPEQVFRGRIVDSQGRPATSVKVWVCSVGGREAGKLGQVAPVLFWGEPKPFEPWPKPVTTDGRGRFVLRGLNQDRGAEIQVQDERFAKQIFFLPRPTDTEVTFKAAPAHLIEGRVVAVDTGKPIANAHLTAYATDSDEFALLGAGTGMAGDADEKGHFALNPFPGKAYGVTAYPPAGQPYLIGRQAFLWPAGAAKQSIEIKLARGVLARGKITETGSGKPVAGAVVEYIPHHDNPNQRGFVSGWQGAVASGSDGDFEIVVIPGRGSLLVRADPPDFIHLETSEGAIHSNRTGGQRLYPDGLVALDLKSSEQTHDVSVSLRRGVTVRGSLVGADGKAIAGALMICRLSIRDAYRNSPEVRLPDGRFELRGADPEKTMHAYFLDPQNRQSAAITLTGKEMKAPVAVHLVPCGVARARFVDAEGKPLGGHQAMPVIVLTPGAMPYGRRAPGALLADSYMLANLDRATYWPAPRTDAQGRVSFPALIPGATYRIVSTEKSGHIVAKDFMVESGKITDLGDLTYKEPEWASGGTP